VTGRHQKDHFTLQITAPDPGLGLVLQARIFGLGLETQALDLIIISAWITFHVVYVIQVKVLLRQRLKLIVMISVSIHMMTSQDHICVRCVKNGLQGKDI